jgi:DNA-3-methyladenine glycosylase
MSNFSFLDTDVISAASRLLGCELERIIDGHTVRVRIVETEAYHQEDAASHSFKGKTARNAIMFGPSGRLYVYFTYGMHYCCNVVVGEEGTGAAVLIRAVEPIKGIELLHQYRKATNDHDLTNGPAKLCQALVINKQLNDHDLSVKPFRLIECPALSSSQIVQTTRIGISKAKNEPWRFYIKDNPYVSRK